MLPKTVKHFGYFIHAQRRVKGWTRLELAQRAGLSEQSINRVEKKASADGLQSATLGGLARAFDMTPDDLVAVAARTAVRVPSFRKPKRTALYELCSRHGVTDRAGTVGRIASWLLEQPDAVQRAALGLHRKG